MSAPSADPDSTSGATSAGKRSRVAASPPGDSPWLPEEPSALDTSVGAASVATATVDDACRATATPLTAAALEAGHLSTASAPVRSATPAPMSRTPGSLAAFFTGMTSPLPPAMPSGSAGAMRRSRSRLLSPATGLLVQSHLDFGQRNVGGCVVCRACGMVYTLGVGPEEERRHAAVCRTGEPVPPKWTGGSAGASHRAGSAADGSAVGPSVVTFHVARHVQAPKEGNWHRVHAFLCDVLGPRSSPWASASRHSSGSVTSSGSGIALAASADGCGATGAADGLSCLLVAAVSATGDLEAAASFAPITTAWATVTGPPSLSPSPPPAPPPSATAVHDSGGGSASHATLDDLPVWQDGDDLVRCTHAAPAALCVAQIWVAPSARRRGLARELLRHGRIAALSDGSTLPAALVAFSQPTRAGMALARAWTAREGSPLLLVA